MRKLLPLFAFGLGFAIALYPKSTLWDIFYLTHIHFLVWGIFAAVVALSMPVIKRCSLKGHWLPLALLAAVGVFDVVVYRPMWRVLNDDAVIASTATTLTLKGSLGFPLNFAQFSAQGQLKNTDIYPAKRPAGLPALGTLLNYVHYSPFATVHVNTALLFALALSQYLFFSRYSRIGSFLVSVLMLITPAVREVFLGGGLEPLFLACAAVTVMSLLSANPAFKRLGMAVGVLGCFSRYESFAFLVPAIFLLGWQTHTLKKLIPIMLLLGVVMGLQSVVYRAFGENDAVFTLAGWHANLTAIRQTLTIPYALIPFGWADIALVLAALFLLRKRHLCSAMLVPLLMIGFFCTVLLLFSWPINHYNMWRFLAFLLLPLMWFLFLNPNRYVLCGLIALQIIAGTRTQWMAATPNQLICEQGILPLLKQAQRTEYVLTPRVSLLYPFRQSSAMIGTPFEGRVPKLGVDFFTRFQYVDSTGRRLDNKNTPLLPLFDTPQPMFKMEQYAESTASDSGVVVIVNYRRKQ